MKAVASSGIQRAPEMLYFLEIDLYDLANNVGQSVMDQFTWADEEDKQKYFEMVMAFGGNMWSRALEFDPFAAHTLNGLYELIEKTDMTLTPDDFMNLCNDWEKYWILNTDMGLIYRLSIELYALGEYNTFPSWVAAEPNSIGSNELFIDCKWSAPATGSIKTQAKTKVPNN
jgi:hypothetical protein